MQAQIQALAELQKQLFKSKTLETYLWRFYIDYYQFF